MNQISRLALGLGLVGISGVLSACGSGVPGVVVASRSVPAAVQASNAADLQVIEQRMNAELQSAKATQPLPNPAGVAGEQPVDSILSVKQSERLSALQSLGRSQINTDLQDISQLQATLLSNRRLTAAERSGLTALLANDAAVLNADLASLNGAPMVNMARSDLQNITSARIQGFVDPQVHMTVAAEQLLQLLPVYQHADQVLHAQINNRLAQGKPVGNAPALVTDMDRQLEVMNSVAESALTTLSSLTASGFPGNQAELNAVRNSLLQAQTAANSAGNDAINIRALVG